MRVVVTGGAGFLGTRIVEGLRSATREVIVVDALLHGQPKPDGPFLQLDLCYRTSAVEIARLDPDVVVHLAAASFIPECERDPNNAFEHNVTATSHLVAELPRCRFVFASSAAVYRTSDAPHLESEPCAPATAYGVSKLLSEELIQIHARATGATNQTLRMANVYGPGDYIRHVIPSIVRQVKAAQGTLRLGNLSASRDWIWLNDVVRVFETAVAEPFRYPTVNVGTGQVVLVRRVVELALEAAGHSPRIETGDDLLRADDPDVVSLDTDRLRSTPGCSPQVSLRDGLASLLSDRNRQPSPAEFPGGRARC